MVNAYHTLFLSFEADAGLLWLSGWIMGFRPHMGRVALGATVGSLPTLWVLVAQNIYVVPWYVIVIWPVAMLYSALGELPRKLWLKAYGVLISLTFLTAGTIYFLRQWLAQDNIFLRYFDWAIIAIPLVVWFISRVGARQMVTQIVGKSHHGDIELTLNGKSLTVPVLWDSGNQMRDPVLRRPVVVVEMHAALDWLPQEVFAWVVSVSGGQHVPVPEGWQGRMGIVSFHSLGGQGILPVVAVDQARGRRLGKWSALLPVVVGLTTNSVSHDHSYQALVSPQCLLDDHKEGVGA